MAEETLHVVYLGLDDFPLGLAETQKVRLVSKGLIEAGARVTVLSRWWSAATWKDTNSLPAEGVYDTVPYVNACGFLSRPSSWIRRKIVRLRGLLREFRAIARWSRGKNMVAILSTGTFTKVLYYRALSRVFGFPLVVHVVEYYSAIFRNARAKKRLNAFLFDRYASRLADGALPISEFLIGLLNRYNAGTPWLKDPGLVDVKRFEGIARRPGRDYLLFCGYLGYMEIVRFILQAFDGVHSERDTELVLVLNGTESEFARFNTELATMQRKNFVRICSDLTDRELSQLYVDAYALLIPLRPTEQDRARFPHKIGEYCASGRPLITTAIGEVGARFTHGVNAFVASEYSVTAYRQAIHEALRNPAQAEAVGRAGRELAFQIFDYRRFGTMMLSFLKDLRAAQGDQSPAPVAELTGNPS